MDARKQAICDALRAFINQRPGFDPRNYADQASYRSESRAATRDLRIARQLLRQVQLRGDITADAILKAARFGRLAIRDLLNPVEVDYCTGQHFPTEFRAAAARLLASVLWEHMRDRCMPKPCHTSGDGLDLYGLKGLNAGDWLRAYFHREFGSGIANRFFN